MEIVVLNPKHKSLIEETPDKSQLHTILNFKEKYKGYNEVFDSLLLLQDKKVVNYCLISGTQDSRLYSLKFLDISKSKFVQDSIHYVFTKYSAETISIISLSDASNYLIPLGFEDLGVEGEVHLYLKDKTIEQKRERSK